MPIKKPISAIDEIMHEIRDDLKPGNVLKEILPEPKELFGDVLPPSPHELLREILVGEKKKRITKEE